ncbi:12945_t:CDS:2 [Cetraspora pellucida]|uniref:12945_t:CDS:1 n=1 Tax=Cetraspora pellucida TaxID=1433469 RepID=A0A9N9FRR6_9GLOM|nr:12945_t:CDS:2 [Cetraspora pellucida]
MSKLYNFIQKLLPEKMSGNNMTKNQLLAEVNRLMTALDDQKREMKETHANEIKTRKKHEYEYSERLKEKDKILKHEKKTYKHERETHKHEKEEREKIYKRETDLMQQTINRLEQTINNLQTQLRNYENVSTPKY